MYKVSNLISKGSSRLGLGYKAKKLSTLSLESEHYGYRSYYWQSLGSCYQYWGKKREKGTNTRRVSGRICWPQVCGEFFNHLKKNTIFVQKRQLELLHWNTSKLHGCQRGIVTYVLSNPLYFYQTFTSSSSITIQKLKKHW